MKIKEKDFKKGKKEEKKDKNKNFWKKMGNYVKKALDCCKE